MNLFLGSSIGRFTNPGHLPAKDRQGARPIPEDGGLVDVQLRDRRSRNGGLAPFQARGSEAVLGTLAGERAFFQLGFVDLNRAAVLEFDGIDKALGVLDQEFTAPVFFPVHHGYGREFSRPQMRRRVRFDAYGIVTRKAVHSGPPGTI